MSIRVMIADDDPGMRILLKKAVESHAAFQVCYEADNGQEVMNYLEQIGPDLIFLDVEMPIMDGIETARRIQDIAPDIALVFVTAHEGYRTEAFEVYAMDYLVKPFSIDRLNMTLDRLENWLRMRSAADAAPQTPAVATAQPKRDRLLIKSRDESVVVPFSDIAMVKRENRQSMICLNDGTSIATHETLSELEARLSPEIFLRCHKSYIINLNYVSRIYPYGRWTYITRLRGTKFDALITREKYEEIESLLLS